ncbi:MAG: hypothetical protein Q4A82_02370 [Corynebacterium sp.]|nr:hypothetical protein [Corynebacterium sp.]
MRHLAVLIIALGGFGTYLICYMSKEDHAACHYITIVIMSGLTLFNLILLIINWRTHHKLMKDIDHQRRLRYHQNAPKLPEEIYNG